MVDQQKFEVALENIRKLQPKAIGNCHSPLARGITETHLKAMAKLPAMGPIPLPDNAALQGILTQMQGVAGHVN